MAVTLYVITHPATLRCCLRRRLIITEPDKPHFMTCTVLEWLPVFTRPETFNIIVDCWRYQQLARRNCETLPSNNLLAANRLYN